MRWIVLGLGVLSTTARADPGGTGTFAVGASYNTDDSFGASAEITQPDLFHTGNLLGLEALIDAREQRATLRFVDPFARDSELSAKLVMDDKLLNGFTRKSAGTDLEVSHLIAPHTKLYAGYRFEAVDAAGARYEVAALRIGDEYSTLDQPAMATRGSRVGAVLEYASPQLGGTVALVHTKAYAETHQPLGAFILHVAGSTETMTGPDGVPLGEQLYLDGSSQLRGYRPNAVGPIDLAGHRLGGTSAFFGHAELELPVVKRCGLSVTGFADGGGIFGARAGELAASTGFGLVWRSPIGPIGGYWAWTADGGPHFVFGIGGFGY